LDSVYRSFLAPDINAYAMYQKASGRWSDTYEKNMRYFDVHCTESYPDALVLTQDMVNEWCAQRSTEKNNSCIARIKVVVGFIKYLRVRDKTDIAVPVFPVKERRTYIPHSFTELELKNFFSACDNLPSKPSVPIVLSRKLTVPVFFRLLYSSGIRTCEARLLQMGDVDLVQGVLSIKHSKGESQHFVVLHDTMLHLLRKYDVAIRSIFPKRQYFFQSPYGSHYHRVWVSSNFRKLWSVYNTSNATAYALRHNYAIENINQWIGYGFEFDSKLLYLSKSMGHSTMESTKYYYNLVPAFADIMEDLSGQSFEDIVPEVEYDESQ